MEKGSLWSDICRHINSVSQNMPLGNCFKVSTSRFMLEGTRPRAAQSSNIYGAARGTTSRDFLTLHAWPSEVSHGKRVSTMLILSGRASPLTDLLALCCMRLLTDCFVRLTILRSNAKSCHDRGRLRQRIRQFFKEATLAGRRGLGELFHCPRLLLIRQKPQFSLAGPEFAS